MIFWNEPITISNGYTCQRCGQWVLNGNFHNCAPPAPQTGWICARCGRSNAPWVASCNCPPPSVGKNTDKLVIKEGASIGTLNTTDAIDATKQETQWTPT